MSKKEANKYLLLSIGQLLLCILLFFNFENFVVRVFISILSGQSIATFIFSVINYLEIKNRIN